MCVLVHGFTPHFYLELPSIGPLGTRDPDNGWTKTTINLLKDKLSILCYEGVRPVGISIVKKRKLFHTERKIVTSSQGGTSTTGRRSEDVYHPFVRLEFASMKAMGIYENYLTKKWDGTVYSASKTKLKLNHVNTYESARYMDPLLKLRSQLKLPPTGWIRVVGGIENTQNKETLCDLEVVCDWKALSPVANDLIVLPKIITIDIEAYSSVHTAMPSIHKPSDQVFQISMITSRGGEIEKKHLLTTKECNPIDGVEVVSCGNEDELFIAFSGFIQAEKPNAILGYNILGWDMNFMIERSKRSTREHLRTADILLTLGFLDRLAVVSLKSWSSSAYGNNNFLSIESDGVVWIDLLPIIKRDHKLKNYKLDTVAEHFVKQKKNPVTPKDIFVAYEKGDAGLLTTVGKYCIQDSFITLQIFNKLQTWISLCEMSKIVKVPMGYLFTRGQQIKTFSQVYEFCTHNGYVTNNTTSAGSGRGGGRGKDEEAAEKEKYTGAIVLTPIPGLYKDVVPLDFASLYPSIIISHNIDYTTYVNDEYSLSEGVLGGVGDRINDVIPNEMCHIHDWEEHVNCKCEKDPLRDIVNTSKAKKKVVCHHFRERFLKSEYGGKGVIPTLLEQLLSSRKSIKKQMKEIEGKLTELNGITADSSSVDSVLKKKEIDELEMLHTVYDRRQNACKISANSMYGIFGASEGILPLKAGAMCVTYVGRCSIEKAAAIVAAHRGLTIYGDTDSCMCVFPHLTIPEKFKVAVEISRETEVVFPKPMKLDFENKIYSKFFILSKKRYIAVTTGKGKEERIEKGVVLVRRDNCRVLKDVYSEVVNRIFNHIDVISQETNERAQLKPGEKLIVFAPDEKRRTEVITEILNYITDAINRLFSWTPSTTVDHEKEGRTGAFYENFIITKSIGRTEYKCEPPHLVLAGRMRKRGIHVAAGSRIDYVITTQGGMKAKQSEKVEDADYFRTYRELLRVDFQYILEHQLLNPLEEVLETGLGVFNFMKKTCLFRVAKQKICDRIRRIGIVPEITFETGEETDQSIRKKIGCLSVQERGMLLGGDDVVEEVE